jgi:hypothetical protein
MSHVATTIKATISAVPHAHRRAALVRGADDERGCEQPDAELHPALAEVPRVAVADHREPGGQQRQRRGRQRQWPDPPQGADEAPGLLRLADPQDADRERGQDHQRTKPHHRGEDVGQHEPVVERS